jgi:hypothetical protein
MLSRNESSSSCPILGPEFELLLLYNLSIASSRSPNSALLHTHAVPQNFSPLQAPRASITTTILLLQPHLVF